VNVSRSVSLEGNIKFYRLRYRGRGDWNLRADLGHPKSFEQKAWGDGFDAGIEVRWVVSSKWSLGVGVDARRWAAVNGTAKTFPSDGSPGQTVRLNDALWSSNSFHAAMIRRFRS
jgi:hypothetical protein